jgi:ABC-type phosphate transport system substrate-binding protein
MIAMHKAIWDDYCQRSGRAPACGYTSFYPTVKGVVAQSGDLGIAGYVSQSFAEGAIGYVNYSYALGVQFPVAKVLNKAGFYTEPTPQNVAVSLLKAKINKDGIWLEQMEVNPGRFIPESLRLLKGERRSAPRPLQARRAPSRPTSAREPCFTARTSSTRPGFRNRT